MISWDLEKEIQRMTSRLSSHSESPIKKTKSPKKIGARHRVVRQWRAIDGSQYCGCRAADQGARAAPLSTSRPRDSSEPGLVDPRNGLRIRETRSGSGKRDRDPRARLVSTINRRRCRAGPAQRCRPSGLARSLDGLRGLAYRAWGRGGGRRRPGGGGFRGRR